MRCHQFRSIPGRGVNLCTLLKGHRGNHLDTVFNVAWPVVAEQSFDDRYNEDRKAGGAAPTRTVVSPTPEPCCPGAARGRCKVGCHAND